MENRNHVNRPRPAFRTLNMEFSRVRKPRVWVNGRWRALRPFSNTKNACMGLRIIEGQGQPPFTKSASADLGICGNGQTMEEGDLGDVPGAQTFPGLLPGTRALVMARWLAKVSFVTPSSVLPLYELWARKSQKFPLPQINHHKPTDFSFTKQFRSLILKTQIQMTSLLCSKLFTASRRSKQEITTSHLPLQVKPARKRCSSQKLDGPQVPQHSCFSCISKPHSHMTQVLGNKDTTPEGRLSWKRALG